MVWDIIAMVGAVAALVVSHLMFTLVGLNIAKDDHGAIRFGFWIGVGFFTLAMILLASVKLGA